MERQLKKDSISDLLDKNSCDNSVLSGLFSLSPVQFALLSSLIGFLFVDGLDLGQQNSLGNFIVNIGQTILTSAAQGQLLQDSQNQPAQNDNRQNGDLQQQIELLKKQVDSLEKKVSRH